MRAVFHLFLVAALLLTAAMSIPPHSQSDRCSGWKPSYIFGPDDLPGMMSWDDARYNLGNMLKMDEVPWTNDPEDSYYILPTQEDIDDLMKFYRSHRAGFNYVPESWDCDDFATELKYWATVWSMHRYQKTPSAVLVGKAYVRLHGNYELLFPNLKGRYVEGYHALNFVMRADGQILFIEPQTGLVVPIDSFIYEDSLTVMRIEY